MAIKWGCVLLILIFLLILHPSLVLADVERVILTPELLQERIKSPQLQEGILTLDLTSLEIDLTGENNEFKETFYRQLQNYLNHSDKVTGLDFSHSLIKGDFFSNRLGISTVLSPEALPQNLTITEQKIIESNDKFSKQSPEKMSSVILFRGSLQLNEALLTGKVDFKNTIFLQKFEAKNSKFKKEINFNNTYFGRKADFNGSVFEENANFNGTQFQEAVKFNQVQFLGDSTFNYSQFKQSSSFSESIFNKIVNFSHVFWSNNSDFISIDCRDRIVFFNSIFSGLTNFSNSTFEKSIAFRNTYFGNLVNLKDVKLLGIMDFSNAEFLREKAINIAGFAFDSDGAKVLGNTGEISRFMYLNSIQGNETVLRNFIQNFRDSEQIPDANQLEYKKQKLLQQQLSAQIIKTPYQDYWKLTFIQKVGHWLFLNVLLLLSQYGTNFSLLLGIGLISIGYFGVLFWLLDRWRRRYPKPIIPNVYDTICIMSSGLSLLSIGTLEIFNSAEYPLITLLCLSLLLIPIPLSLVSLIYEQGRYHDLMESSYFLLDGSMRQLQLLIVRLPVIPEFPFFRDRYTPLVWERRWNWLNYYDFSLNNFIKLGFNDIRLRDQHLPGLISTLVWYQWTLGLLYIALFLWTLSRTIPGLNLLIYLK
ncbi:MAG: pentapeptide repeat-containing protein [Crocosphaera sp.]|nr:pentapeptide repeat-containing protein [Crocosphaera sp.]